MTTLGMPPAAHRRLCHTLASLAPAGPAPTAAGIVIEEIVGYPKVNLKFTGLTNNLGQL
jgi:hypothetical protein